MSIGRAFCGSNLWRFDRSRGNGGQTFGCVKCSHWDAWLWSYFPWWSLYWKRDDDTASTLFFCGPVLPHLRSFALRTRRRNSHSACRRDLRPNRFTFISTSPIKSTNHVAIERLVVHLFNFFQQACMKNSMQVGSINIVHIGLVKLRYMIYILWHSPLIKVECHSVLAYVCRFCIDEFVAPTF